MPRRHEITYLDGDVRTRIDQFLAEKQRTVDEFHAFLAEELDLGISRSASHRYMQSFEEEVSALRESRQAAEALAQEIGSDTLQTKQGRVMIELFQSLLQTTVREKIRAGVGVDSKDMMQLGRALKDVFAASKTNIDELVKVREMEIREEERRKTQADAAEVAEGAARKAGLSDDGVAAMRAAIMEQL